MQLLKPRSSCRLLLGILLLAAFAGVGFWVHGTPFDVNQEVSGVLEVGHKGRKRSETEAQGKDDSTQDYSMRPNSSYARLFAAEVRALTNTLPELNIVLTTTNMGYLDFTENMLLSIDRVGIHPEVVVIAEDRGSYKALLDHKYGLHVLKPPDFNKLPEAIDFGVPDHQKFTIRRPAYVREFIKQGYEVLFVDSDTFWFQDPYPYFQGGSFDVAFMRDYRKTFSDGVGFYRPTNSTDYFLRVWVWVLDTQPKLRQDQRVVSYVLSSKLSPDLKIRSLGFQTFPTCKNLYDSDNEVCRNVTDKTTLFHAAFTPLHVDKRKVFDKCNIWLVNTTTEKTPS
ncbi:UDP-D-xylose:L-fucose alpha-1,3-D-xylosyltransferase MGP4-like isoform X2 [Patiria miniata]|nr:UDP-D-xylose:L-fucose alpha-1,3-D-xylosyltransferase MGP4-like isoform X2 [Patiria miniata]